MKGDHASLQPGTLIADQFRLRCKIGEGGNGAVWEADHLRLGSVVAIKFMSPEYLNIEAEKLRFANEARAASKLRSPHVVQVLDHGTTADHIPYLVMERLEGCDLATHLDRVGRCSLIETVLILEQIGHAVTKAHAQGLVHRDIKPNNVFLTPQGDGAPFVKLLDFGIAKDIALEVDSITMNGALMGSVHYASPEQLRDARSVGPATDIWALGVVAYEMLTGVVPFYGNSLPEVLARVDRASFQAASRLQSELPREIDAWLRSAIHLNPASRFASADDMMRALAHIVREHAPVLPASIALTANTRAPADALPTRRTAGWLARSQTAGWLARIREHTALSKPTKLGVTAVAAALGCIALGAVLTLKALLAAQAPSAQGIPSPNIVHAAPLARGAEPSLSTAQLEMPIDVAHQRAPEPVSPPSAATGLRPARGDATSISARDPSTRSTPNAGVHTNKRKPAKRPKASVRGSALDSGAAAEPLGESSRSTYRGF